MKEITKNELFEEQRQIIHSEIITNHENKVKNFAIAKLLAIIVVAVGQLYLLKKMLDKQGQGYQPVWSLYASIFKNHKVKLDIYNHDATGW